MIFIAIVRRCRCEICSGTFDLAPEEKPPVQCRLCGSSLWLWGPQVDTYKQMNARFTRQGITFKERTLDKGAKSRARQEQGKRQWRGFKPKPIDSPQNQT
jgi:DNA-directed RNA polymerase subunit RPC12/RpoP